METEILKGKILKILDQYRVVINLGSEHGVKEGMEFIIYEEGEMIKDPETGEDLENLEIVKGTVRVTTIQQKISIAESFEIVKKIYSPMKVIVDMYREERVIKERKALTEEEIEAPETPPVKVGDLVRQTR